MAKTMAMDTTGLSGLRSADSKKCFSNYTHGLQVTASFSQVPFWIRSRSLYFDLQFQISQVLFGLGFQYHLTSGGYQDPIVFFPGAYSFHLGI